MAQPPTRKPPSTMSHFKIQSVLNCLLCMGMGYLFHESINRPLPMPVGETTVKPQAASFASGNFTGSLLNIFGITNDDQSSGPNHGEENISRPSKHPSLAHSPSPTPRQSPSPKQPESHEKKSVVVKKAVDKPKERRAIIHIGPPKTGSTFIQILLLEEKELLASDGVLVAQPEDAPGHHMGAKSTANVAQSLRNRNIVPFLHENTNTLRKFVEFMHASMEKEKDVLVSAEDFSDDGMSVQALAWILKPWDRVTIIMVYRRYFEWLLSVYFERYRLESIPPERQFVPIPSFVELIRFARRVDKLLKSPIQISEVKKRFKKYFHDFVVVNYNDKSKPLFANFFCTLQLKNTCNTLTNKGLNTGVERFTNNHFSLEYVRLVQMAITHHLTRKNCDVAEAAKLVEKQLARNNRTWRDLPLDCLEDVIVEELYNVAVQEEKELLPEWHEQTGRHSIRGDFEKLKASKAFCTVKTTQVLEDSKWRAFFRTL